MKIRRNKRWNTQPWLAFLAVVMLFCWGAPLHGQSAVAPTSDGDVTQRQVASLDRFLDSHPEIAEQLRRNPSLINSEEFVENHPALQDYLRQHPGVREEFSENPQAFMRQEQRFERGEEAREGVVGDHDITRREIAGMDNFLDGHPEIAEQLRRDPSLINNRQFVENHPELQEFLQQHPGIREQFSANPQAFMNREDRFEQREGERGEVIDNDNDMNRRPVARMDKFLDNHPEIAEQLQRNPSLVNNQEFVENHPDLQQFLQQHPEIREQFQANPQAFMQREQRFDQREENNMRVGDRDRIRDEASGFSAFLGSHPQIAQEVSGNPTLVNDKEFLEHHGELREFLKAHPVVKQELTSNPQEFMNAVQQAGNGTTGKVFTPKEKKHQ